MRAAPFTQSFLYLTGGLIIWAVRFLAIYPFTALACARGWSQASLAGIGMVPLVMSLSAIVAVLGCAAILLRALARMGDRSSDEIAQNARFVHVVAASVAALAILAMIWETLPVLFISTCG